MKGAVECIENGIFSSLQPQNIRLSRAVRTISQKNCSTSSLYPLLFDPQTAGGLLATVPRENAKQCVEDLIELGYVDTCIVGEIILESEQPVNDRGVEIIMGKYGEGGGGEDEEESTSSSRRSSSSVRKRK